MVEITLVAVLGQRWEGGVQSAEVYAFKKRMRFERSVVVGRAGRACSKSVVWIELQQALDQVSDFWLELIRYHDLTICDLLEDLVID